MARKTGKKEEVEEKYPGIPSTEELQKIRSEMEDTRREMGRTIDAIRERIPLSRLREEAEVRARAELVGRRIPAENLIVQGIGRAVEEALKRHPVLSGLAGMGLAWLATDRLDGRKTKEEDR